MLAPKISPMDESNISSNSALLKSLVKPSVRAGIRVVVVRIGFVRSPRKCEKRQIERVRLIGTILLTSRETGDDAVLFGEFGNCLRAAVPAAQGDDSGHAWVRDQGPVHVIHVGQGELEHEFLVTAKRFQLNAKNYDAIIEIGQCRENDSVVTVGQ